MIGTSIPRLSSCSTMCGTAAAASSLFTVTRTSSDPARASDAICSTLEATSAVSVLVMDCTTTGASAPTRTLPMVQVTDLRRWIDAMWKVQFNRLNRAASAMGTAGTFSFTSCTQLRQPLRYGLGDIVVNHHCREQNQKHERSLIDAFFDLEADIAAHQAFDEKQQNHAAIHDRDGQQIKDPKIKTDGCAQG